MLNSQEIWSCLTEWMPEGQWLQLDEIYGLVEDHSVLEKDDFWPDAPGSSGLRWRRNVRNVLQKRKTSGDLLWERPARYLRP